MFFTAIISPIPNRQLLVKTFGTLPASFVWMASPVRQSRLGLLPSYVEGDRGRYSIAKQGESKSDGAAGIASCSLHQPEQPLLYPTNHDATKLVATVQQSLSSMKIERL
jgi:hypothetical protein